MDSTKHTSKVLLCYYCNEMVTFLMRKDIKLQNDLKLGLSNLGELKFPVVQELFKVDMVPSARTDLMGLV